MAGRDLRDKRYVYWWADSIYFNVRLDTERPCLLVIIGTLADAPKLAVGDGVLGFWAAVEEEFPKIREQRCWVHKTVNVLDHLPKSVQPYAKRLIHEMYLSPTRETAQNAYKRFLSEFSAKSEGDRLPAQGRGHIVHLLRFSG